MCRRVTRRSRTFLAKFERSRGDRCQPCHFFHRSHQHSPKGPRTTQETTDTMYFFDFEGHLACLGEISEQRSLIRIVINHRDENVSVHKGWAACGLHNYLLYIACILSVSGGLLTGTTNADSDSPHELQAKMISSFVRLFAFFAVIAVGEFY